LFGLAWNTVQLCGIHTKSLDQLTLPLTFHHQRSFFLLLICGAATELGLKLAKNGSLNNTSASFSVLIKAFT